MATIKTRVRQMICLTYIGVDSLRRKDLSHGAPDHLERLAAQVIRVDNKHRLIKVGLSGPTPFMLFRLQIFVACLLVLNNLLILSKKGCKSMFAKGIGTSEIKIAKMR